MTDNQSGKGHSFAKRIYLPRIIGTAISLLCIMPSIAPLDLPLWAWALLLVNALAWPHVAYRLATRSARPYQVEQRSLLLDGLMAGFWTAAMHFNPLPSVTLLSMTAMNNVAAGGKQLFLRGLLAQATGMLVAAALLGPGLQLQATQLQVYACLPMLTFYPMAVGWVCYRLAIKLSDHKRRLSALSRTDSLTGLLNHGSWKDLLQAKFRMCEQQHVPAVLALIDIDHFKRINDTYGHVIGDWVLGQLSLELKQTLGQDDLTGRYGGDEFGVILPLGSEAQACQTLERLCERVSQYRNPRLPELRISLSIGLASFHNGLQTPEDWLDAADKALYTAKRDGRNRVNAAPCDATEPGSALHTR